MHKFQKGSLNTRETSEMRMFLSSLFHSITVEGKKGCQNSYVLLSHLVTDHRFL